MYVILRRSFDGLTADYYIRHIIPGAMIPLLVLGTAGPRALSIPSSLYIAGIANTLLYPYARFACERFVGFVMSFNVLVVNWILDLSGNVLTVKVLTFAFCWGVAIALAPIGLVYLYFWHPCMARLGLVLARWTCGVIARLYLQLTVLLWWWELRRQTARPMRKEAGARWRRYLGRRRLERELRAALLGIHAAGVARGLCGPDEEAGRRLVEQVQTVCGGGRRTPMHFPVLLKFMLLVSCWLGRLLLVCNVKAGCERLPCRSSGAFRSHDAD
jgi:hypothetical protein